MGQTILERVVKLLNDGGVPANYAQPAGKMVNVLMPVAAVSIQSVDQAKRNAMVRVEIVGLAQEGGHRCELRAMQAYDLLRAAGAVCQVQRCSFNGNKGVFSVPVLASFDGDASWMDWIPLEQTQHTLSVHIGESELPYLTQFTAMQAVNDADTDELSDMSWKFTLEEWIPAGETDPEGPKGLFEMTITTDTIREHFEGCCLVSLEREMEVSGVRQVRKGVAALRTVEQLA